MAMAKQSNSRSIVFDNFIITDDGKFYMCQIKNEKGEMCKGKISSYSGEGNNAPSRASNLKRHLQRAHSKIFDAVDEADKRNIKIRNSEASKTSHGQSEINKLFKSNKVTVCMTADNFKKLIIEMVFKNSVPLTFFSTPPFVGLNGEMAKILNVSLERNNIRHMVLTEAHNKKEMLKSVLRDRFVFLKMDACTRHRVNYFAINVQFVNNSNEVVTYTLAIRDTEAQHKSIYLQELVQGILDEYEIAKSQVLSIVTDNATNMLSLVTKMNINESDDEEANESSEDEGNVISEQTDRELDELIASAARLSKIHHM